MSPLLTILKQLHTDMQDPANWISYGLCSRIPKDYKPIVHSMFLCWPKYSGNVKFPVPDPRVPGPGMAAKAYRDAFHISMWDRSRPYGALRWELLEFMIDILEVEEMWTNKAAAGYLPGMFHPSDPRPAEAQLFEHYGQVTPFDGFTLTLTADKCIMEYPDDPPIYEVSRAKLRDELLVLFEYSWLTIVNLKDNSFKVYRVD